MYIAARTCATSAPYINIDQPVTMVDTEMKISVHQVKPYQKITVVAHVEEKPVRYISYAHFVADHHGTVSLKNDPSLGGTYSGIESMGLFWSMRPSSEERPGTRLFKTNINSPFYTKLGVVYGFKDVKNWINIKDNIQCEKSVERWYLASDTKRIKVNAGRIRGTMFTPKGDSKRVDIIDLFGSQGGISENRAAQLASYGYTTLALAFFNYDDLPKSECFDYDYFDEAVEFMLKHPLVDDEQDLAVIGFSKGAEIALHMASYNPRIKVCISVNANHAYTFGRHTYKGKLMNTKFPNLDKMDKIRTSEGISLSEGRKDMGNADLIPVQNSKAHFLLLQSADDTIVPYDHVLQLGHRIRESGNQNCVVKIYPGAGHMLEQPFTPLCRSSYHRYLREIILCGGSVRLHAYAQQRSWAEILNFLSQHFQNNYTGIGRLPSCNV